MQGETVDLSIEPQTPVRGIAKAVAQAGIDVNSDVLFLFFRLSGQSRALRAGSYEITQGESVLDLLRKLSPIDAIFVVRAYSPRSGSCRM